MRKMKEYIFLDLNDGSSPEMLQILVKKPVNISGLDYGSSVRIEGEVAMGQKNRVEVKAENIQVIGKCDYVNGYPFFPKKTYSPDYVREHLHFRPRTRWFTSLLRLRDTASMAISEHLHSRDFVHVHTPILTSNDCEGAGETFLVKPDSQNVVQAMKRKGQEGDEDAYFNGKAFLTVSGQLQLEAAVR